MSLPDLFKRQGALASLRPGNIQSLFQTEAPEEEPKPQLLQRLAMVARSALYSYADCQSAETVVMLFLALPADVDHTLIYYSTVNNFFPVIPGWKLPCSTCQRAVPAIMLTTQSGALGSCNLMHTDR